jgi:hypothetical protein
MKPHIGHEHEESCGVVDFCRGDYNIRWLMRPIARMGLKALIFAPDSAQLAGRFVGSGGQK